MILGLVDTNIIADVVGSDPNWQEWSTARLIEHAGRLAINPMIYAEICYRAPSRLAADEIVARLELDFLELPKDALFAAAKAFEAYRRAGGTRSAPLADFFIGAHAEATGLFLLTRDKARYQTYFPSVQLISPP